MNSQNENELVEVENKYWKDLNHALKQLHENPHFQKVILEGYFKDKAVDGVSMLANPVVMREGKRGEILESLVAVSHLQDYFITISNLGEVVEDDSENGDTDDLNVFTPGVM